MSESKRGVVMLLQAGDPEITGAIAEGIMAGRSVAAPGTSSVTALPCHLPQRGRLNAEQIETVEAEIDRQAIEEAMNRPQVQRSLLRVAVGNSKTKEDYAMLSFEAEMDYGENLYEPGWWDKIADKALGIYGLFVYALHNVNRAQDKVLGG